MSGDEVGAAITRYVQRKAIISTYFIGSDLVELHAVNLEANDPVVCGELCRLSAPTRRLC